MRVFGLICFGAVLAWGQAPTETKGLPPRATPADYQAHAAVGDVTLAAESTGHSIPTAQGTLTSEDFVVVELGLFGAPGAKLKLSAEDFSLRVNGKKPIPSQPYGLVLPTVKDPEWVPPEPATPKSKTNMTGSGKEQGDSGPPPPVKVPFPVQRAMGLRVQKAALPEGERALPQAGLLFFPYRGKDEGMHSVELIYAGSAGKVTLTLHQ